MPPQRSSVSRSGPSRAEPREAPDDYDEPLSVAFSRGKMRGTEACNGIQGTYEQTGARGRDLRIEIRVMTTAACDSPPLASRMSAVRHVSGLGAVRYLHAANWMIVAELRPGDGH
nr:META domain-containing protein [Nocardioides sp.]